MKKLTVAVFLVLFISLAGSGQTGNLDEILASHRKALGYEQLAKVNTIIISGMNIQNDAMPVKIYRMRPNFYLMEYDVADLTAYQGYDGTHAWMTTPWAGNNNHQPMPEDRTKELLSRADFDGVLVEWQTKGHQVELAGFDTIAGAPAWKLKVVKKDGFTEHYSLDITSGLISKRAYTRLIRGQETLVEIIYRDYRQVGGIMFPFLQETFIGGNPYGSMQFDAVELDKPVDPGIFK